MVVVNGGAGSENYHHWLYRLNSLPASYMVPLEGLMAEAREYMYLYIWRGDEKNYLLIKTRKK